MSRPQLLLLFLLAALWGSSFMFMRVAVPYFGAIPLSAVRSLLAALALCPFLFQASRLPLIRKHWLALLVIGPISTSIPFSLLAFTTEYTSAGFTAILNALTPICSALIGFCWIREKLSLRAMAGICLGFIGVSLLVFDKQTISSSLPFLPVLAGMLATFCYGLTAHFSRRYLSTLPSTMIAAACQVSSALFLLPLAILLWPSETIANSQWLVAGFLGLFCTALPFLMYFHLLEQVGVAKTVVVTYLIPLFAMLWGKLFLDEIITLAMLGGASLILAGIGLTTRKAAVKGTASASETTS